eukprot:6079391-Pyramimonas_sp.AAC.1
MGAVPPCQRSHCDPRRWSSLLWGHETREGVCRKWARRRKASAATGALGGAPYYDGATKRARGAL